MGCSSGKCTGKNPRWIVTLPKNSIRLHLLQIPLKHTADHEKAEASRFTWGCRGSERIAGDGPVRSVPIYTLTPLGILNGLFGFKVWITE